MSKGQKATKDGIEYIKRWNKENGRRVLLQFNKESDADVIEWLDRQASKIDAVRQLIREAIKAGK